MRYPENEVTVDDTRVHADAHVPGKCFYCEGTLGNPHGAECVVPNRPVKVRLTMDLVVSAPQKWDQRMIEFHYNDSSWCADNIVEEIHRTVAARQEGYCALCGVTSITYLGEATLEDAVEAGLVPDPDAKA